MTERATVVSFLEDLEILSWSIVYETSQTPSGHAGRILDLCSRRHHLDHDPDAVVFARQADRVAPLEHDPEKWVPVFGKDHAPTITRSGMTIRRKVILL
jgi:hypothetical protein